MKTTTKIRKPSYTPVIKEVKVLFELQQGDKFLVGKVIEIENKRYFDIRSHYVDEKGNKVPTSRGIRLSFSNISNLQFDEFIFSDEFYRDVTGQLLEGGDATQRAQ